MDATGFDALSLSVIEALEAVSRSSEKFYGQVGSSYPEMVRELDANFGGKDQANSGGVVLESLFVNIQEILVLLQDREARFATAQADGRQMMDRWLEQMATLGTLGTNVDEIREDSVLMELLSLNAMVIAAKAGESGRAFACITTELKQLSNQTMGLTDEVARREDGLGRLFEEFRTDWELVEAREREALSGFLVKIGETFEALGTESTKLVDGMARIQSKANDVKPPLVRIMVEIQNQDRIRQGIDHVLISLKEFRGHDHTAAIETRLDDLCYLELLPDLSCLVLDEITTQIRANRTVFHQSLVQAQDLVSRVEHERGDFLSSHVGATSTSGNLESTIAEGHKLFDSFVGEASNILRIRDNLVRKGSQLSKNVGELVEALRSFEVLISRFRNIDLASRIQVARQSQLSSMRDNAAAMTDLTKKIEKDVGQSILAASTFTGAVQVLFSAYQDQFHYHYNEDQGFIAKVQESVSRLQQALLVLLGSIQDSRVFTASFTAHFSQTQADLTSLDGLLETISLQKTNLGSIKDRILAQKKLLMAEKGVTEWKGDKDKLKAMVDGFTIFTHKQFAAGLGQFEVGESVDSGEVTLF